MSRYTRSSFTGIGYPQWTRAVKTLVITCLIVWGVQIIDRLSGAASFTDKFGLRPADVLQGYVWQLGTYIFLHDTGGVMHILFNMLGLWMFGSALERAWGTRQFVRFFFICGVGAGLLMVLLSLLTGRGLYSSTIGASGAVYGTLLAFGVLFPESIIYWIIFPIKAKWFVLIMGVIAFYSSLSSAGSGIAHVAHLGGMLCGFLYLKGGGMAGGLRARYNQWQRARLRKKFDVYYNDRHDDKERWRRWKN